VFDRIVGLHHESIARHQFTKSIKQKVSLIKNLNHEKIYQIISRFISHFWIELLHV